MKKKLLNAIIISSTITSIVATEEAVQALGAEQNTGATSNEQQKTAVNSDTPVLNGIKVNKQLININYSKGITTVPRYIVIHDTDNRQFGANAMANRDYFANHPEAEASAHYTVDKSNIIQCLENTWRGWHCGDRYNPIINNSNTIAIELCVNPDNDFGKTLENGIALTKYLMQKYNIPAENVVRHYDVTGKICPRMMIQDRPDLWVYFKNVISGNQQDTGTIPGSVQPKATGTVVNISTSLNVRNGASGTSTVVNSISPGQAVNIYSEENGWYKIDFMKNGQKQYGYVSKNYILITQGSLSSNTGSSGSNAGGDNNQNNGGQTSNNGQQSSSTKKGKVVNISTNLNVRSAASTSASAISYLKNNTEVTINYEQNGFYNVTFDGNKTGFVSKQYIAVTDTSTVITPSTPSTPSAGTPSSNPSSPTNIGSSNGSDGTMKGKVIGISTSLTIRKGPGANYSAVGYLVNNTEVQIKSQQGDWYQIVAGSKEGYVYKQYIQITSAQSSTNTSGNSSQNSQTYKTGTVINVSTNLNVRQGTGTNYSVIGYLLNNATVKVISEQNGWAQIQFSTTYGVKNGYVKSEYIKF